ncbi:MAG: hypothetical protein ACI4DP_08900 [Candidatus Ornithomonoglobus sp.]
MKKFDSITKRNILLIVLLAALMFVSIFGLSKIAVSPQLHSHTIESLDEKKMTVMELTAAAAVTSTALSAVPGDITTPIANQIADISSYLFIVACAILLEKLLITVTGYLSFCILIPIACILSIIYILLRKQVLRAIAIKLYVFSLAIVMIIPTSVWVSDIVYNLQETQITQAVEISKEMVNDEEAASSVDEKTEDNFFKGTLSKIGQTVSVLTEKAEKALSSFIDAAAVLLITSCVIPIAVIFFIIWFVKILFGININVPKKKKAVSSKE